jgi:hypothetical protein
MSARETSGITLGEKSRITLGESSRITLGVIADDFTGATDVASMLVRESLFFNDARRTSATASIIQ